VLTEGRCRACVDNIAGELSGAALELPACANTPGGISAAAQRAIEDRKALRGEMIETIRPTVSEVAAILARRLTALGVPEVDRATLDKRAIRMAASTAIGLLKNHSDWTPPRAAEIAIRDLESHGEWERTLGQPPLEAVETRLLELIDERGRADGTHAPAPVGAPELVERIHSDVSALGDLLADEVTTLMANLRVHVDGASDALLDIRAITAPQAGPVGADVRTA